ncbi:putative ribonuclease H-like domain-containing protein, partial [Tanacetum coccineum]
LSVCLLVKEFLLVALNVPTGRTVPAGFVGFLEKPKGSADYHQVLDFLRSSHIRYAISHDPIIYDSLVKQFWSTASLGTFEEGPPAIIATIDRTSYIITESLVRSQLQLDDQGGVEDLPLADIYLGMDNMGYPNEGKLTFHKNKFSPQWRFIVHTIMHCLSTKSGSWDQFGSSLATALICLTEGRKFNWSSYIFKGMVNNITNPKKFLMFPRFLQMILNIETRNSKQYHAFKLTSKMFANMRLNFHGDTMPLLATMLPPAQPAIAGESSGEAEPTIPHTVPETLTEPAHSHDQASSPPRPTTIPASAQENEQGPFSDPNPASSSRPHASEPKQFTSTNVEDDVFGGSFDISPPRSTEAPPAGTTSGGAEDPDKLTALCSLVNSLVQKIDSQASDLKAHKLVFKEVVGKLVKKVKELEDKLKGRKRKFVMTESDIEEEEEQDVDPLIKLAKAAATAADDSAVPTGGSNEDDIPPSSSIPSDAFAGGSAIPPDVTTGPTDAPSDKGKSPMLEEEPPVRERSFRQREEDRLGAEAARRLYEEEQAELAREREEQKQKRQKDVLESAKYYTDADWNEIMGQVHANQGLSADLLGPDVNEDNFAERMVAIIAERRTKFAAQRFQDKRNKPMTYAQQRDYMRTFVKNQSSTIYTTGWTMKHVRSFSDAQLKDEFDKIRHAVANLKSQHLRRSLKRQGADLEQPDSKKSKSTEPQKTSIPAASRPLSAGVTPDVHQSPFVDTPPATTPHSPKASSHPDITPDTSKQPSIEVPSQQASQEDVEVPSTTTSTAQQTASSTKKVGTRRKSFGRKGVHPSRSTIPIKDEDPDAEHKICIKYASDADSDSDDDTPVNLHGVVDWELLPTGLGWVNVIYRKDNSRKCFLRLREILHLVTRTDLMIIYGRVMQFYQDTEATGVGLVLWGDLKVLIDSPEVNDGSDVWKNQNTWIIQSWKLYSSTGIHVLETVSGLVLHMFVDKRYPLSVNLIERMLDHQLEICRDTVGNELTTAVQLIAFLKKQISDSRRPKIVVNVGFCLLENLDFWHKDLSRAGPTRDMLEFCRNKGIKQEYSNAKTPQQNRVAERMNRTLIEAARTMLADSLLPTTFWAEAVCTACYIFNRVRVTKPQNKTPYELLFGHKLIISYIRPFGCHVTILDTLSVLGKFDEKCDEGFLVGYSLNSKAFRVYNLVTKKVEVNLHVKFLEEKSNVKGVGYRWMFDIDYLTDSMNYIPVSLENQTNPHAGTSEVTNSAGTLPTPNANAFEEEDAAEELIVVPTAVKHTAAKVGPRMSSTNSKAEEFLTELQNLKTQEKEAYSTGISEDTPEILAFRKELDELAQKHLREVPKNKATSTNSVNSGSGQDNTQPADQDDSDMPELTIFNKPQKGIFDKGIL